MPEKTSTIMYGSAKADSHPLLKKEPSHLAQGITEAIDQWIERIGPKSVEDRFVQAHETIYNSLSDQDQQDAFAKTIPVWRRVGKITGIAATIIDFSLMAQSGKMSMNLLKRPGTIQNSLHNKLHHLNKETREIEHLPYTKTVAFKFTVLNNLHKLLFGNTADRTFQAKPDPTTPQEIYVDRALASAPGFGAVAILAGFGPAHGVAKGIAWTAETIGKMQAKSLNAQHKKAE